MVLYLLLAAFLLSFGATVLLVPAVKAFALKRGFVDVPDGDRKTHPRPVPHIGGLAIAGGFAIGLAVLFAVRNSLPFNISLPGLAVLVGAVIMLITGYVDDTRDLGHKTKFVIQLGVAFMLIQAGFRFDLSGMPYIGDEPFRMALVSIPLTLFWFVGIMNAVNLLDGMDGLTTGVSIIAFAALASIFAINGGDTGLIVIAVLMIGALGGFLVFNFNPASIFMGDSGSLFLGYMLGVFALMGPSQGSPVMAIVIPALVLGLPIMDTGVCFIRRILKGRSPFVADNDHIHHRVSRLWNIRHGVLILYVVALSLGTAAIFASTMTAGIGILIASGTFCIALYAVYLLGYSQHDWAGPTSESADPDRSNERYRLPSGRQSTQSASTAHTSANIVKYSEIGRLHFGQSGS